MFIVTQPNHNSITIPIIMMCPNVAADDAFQYFAHWRTCK